MRDPSDPRVEERPTVSVIVVTYQSEGYVGRCLASIRAHAGMPVETLVVDNASTDATVAEARRFSLATSVITLPANRGFAAAVNVAAPRATGEFLLLLNPDAELLHGALPRLVALTRRCPTVAAAGPQFLFPDGSPQDSAFTYPTLLMTWLEFFPRPARLLRTRLNGRLASTDGRPIRVDHPLGACMLIRRAAWDDVGPLDEAFFLYCEEVDWCVRAKKRGWVVAHVPDAAVVHHGGRSAARARADSIVHLYASRARLHRKHRSPMFRAAARFITTLGLAHVRRQLRRDRTSATDADRDARIAGIERTLHQVR